MSNTNQVPPGRQDFQTSGHLFVCVNPEADFTTSQLPAQQDLTTSDHLFVCVNPEADFTTSQLPAQQDLTTSGHPFVCVNEASSTGKSIQQAAVEGTSTVEQPCCSQLEGPSIGVDDDTSTLAEEVELAGEDVELCAKEVRTMKARIATYKHFTYDLLYKELKDATMAGWTPSILSVLKRTAEELYLKDSAAKITSCNLDMQLSDAEAM